VPYQARVLIYDLTLRTLLAVAISCPALLVLCQSSQVQNQTPPKKTQLAFLDVAITANKDFFFHPFLVTQLIVVTETLVVRLIFKQPVGQENPLLVCFLKMRSTLNPYHTTRKSRMHFERGLARDLHSLDAFVSTFLSLVQLQALVGVIYLAPQPAASLADLPF
jgi:hypothetical protein